MHWATSSMTAVPHACNCCPCLSQGLLPFWPLLMPLLTGQAPQLCQCCLAGRPETSQASPAMHCSTREDSCSPSPLNCLLTQQPGCQLSQPQALQRSKHPPAMYCSTRPDTFSPSPLTASMPAPLAAGPGTALSNLRCEKVCRRCGAVSAGRWLGGARARCSCQCAAVLADCMVAIQPGRLRAFAGPALDAGHTTRSWAWRVRFKTRKNQQTPIDRTALTARR